MAFGIFSKNRNTKENADSRKVASLFKKIRLNVNQPSGKTINRDFSSEPNFGQANQSYAPFGEVNGGSSVHNSAQNYEDSINLQNSAINPESQYSSAFSDPGFTNISKENLQPPLNPDLKSNPGQANTNGANQKESSYQTPPQDEEVVYAVGPSERELKRNDYYTYKANEAYLNEEGRDSGHLYIAPGEPLTPRKPKAEAKQDEVKTPVQTDLFSNNTMVQGDISVNLAKSAQSRVKTSSAKDNSSQKHEPDPASVQKYATTSHEPADNGNLFSSKTGHGEHQSAANPLYTSSYASSKLSSAQQPPYSSVNNSSSKTQYNQTAFPDNSQSVNSHYANSEQNKAINTSDVSNISSTTAHSGVFANVKDNNLNFSLESSHNSASAYAQQNGVQDSSKSGQNFANTDYSTNTTDSYNGTNSQDQNIKSQSPSPDSYANVQNKTAGAALYSASNGVGVQHKDSKSSLTENNSDSQISASVYVAVFFRQLVASFFNFTNLGALFPKQALSILGPSVPAFMPLPYFVVGFITSTLAILVKTFCSSDLLCAIVVTMFFFTMTGSAAFRGIGHLCTAVSLRKLDTYGKILITIFFISLFAASFEYFSTQMNIDIYFSLGIGVIFMLSSFTATTLNFGSSDDPVSSFGTLGLKGLISGTVTCLAVTFTVLDWQIALTMLGICLLCRVLIGQFMDIKGIKAGTDMVCGLQLITSVLLMLELIFTAGYFVFINPVIVG